MLLSVFFLLQGSACATIAVWFKHSETDSFNDVKNSWVGLLKVRRKKLSVLVSTKCLPLPIESSPTCCWLSWASEAFARRAMRHAVATDGFAANLFRPLRGIVVLRRYEDAMIASDKLKNGGTATPVFNCQGGEEIRDGTKRGKNCVYEGVITESKRPRGGICRQCLPLMQLRSAQFKSGAP